MRYRPDEIRPFGLEPYAVYGGLVYSFTCPAATGNRVYDAVLLERILLTAHNRANQIVKERNAQE